MIETTKAIVINSIKFGDTSLITTCFTEQSGIKKYILKGILKTQKSKIKPAHFQPLTQLIITANHNNKGLLNTIKDVEIATFYNTIYTDIKKQTIALFLTEILYYAIQEEEKNKVLFSYLETAFLWLDTHNDIANFHLLFLLNLSKFLGFYPETINNVAPYFDLMDGKFSFKKSNHTFGGNELIQFKKLIGINFEVLDKVDFSASNRQNILTILIQYFEMHLSGFKKPKSLPVLKAVFS